VNALMYHDVVAGGAEDSSGFPGRDAALYKVTPEVFEAHLDAIEGPPVITFDDGGSSATAAAEMLEQRGWRGLFFITTNYIGARGFLTGDAIRDLSRRGHIIGSHSCSHPLRMGHCAWAQLLTEWSDSVAVLSDIVGHAVCDASVPGGDFAPRVADAAARAGITRLFTSEPTMSARRAFGVSVVGRFTIQRWTTASTAAALAAGAWLPCARQAMVWSAKKISKRVGGERYLRIRKLLVGHGDEVQWGDTKG
jgi:peptidoglycan/xylan/chitin deacetylase (PgdA/CDA1 family)